MRIVAVLLLSLVALAAPVFALERPNILVIVADDLGYGDLGCYGGRDIPTPHIDSIARNGVRFTQGYVTAPYCAPSRAGLLTGRHQLRFDYEANPVGKKNLDPEIGLPLSERTIGERLAAAGYKTGLVGKWHLGTAEKFRPQRRGFSEFFGFLQEGHFFVPGPPWPGVTSFLRKSGLPGGEGSRVVDGDVTWSWHTRGNEPPYDEANPMFRGDEVIEEPAYLTDAFGREASAFIARHRAEPWFLYLAYNAPHSPVQAKTGDLARFPAIADQHRRVYAAMVAALDDSIGAVLAKLRETGADENTLIIFLSDHGGLTRETTASNAPLRGGKGQLWEGGIRVPFLMQWKGKFAGGRTSDAVVSALDVLPTALAARGLAVPAELDGVDLLATIEGKAASQNERVLFWRQGGGAALRAGDYKIIRQSESPRSDAAFQLYEVAADPSESRNLAEEKPELLRELRELLKRELRAADEQSQKNRAPSGRGL